MQKNEIAAYAAGLFDGEGNVDVRYRTTHGGKYDRFELRLSVVQLSTGVLDWLVEHFGGSHHVRGSKVSAWVLVGPGAISFLKAVQPFLIVKAAQAAIALEMEGLIGGKRHGPGKRGFHRMPAELWNARRDVMIRLRDQRVRGCPSKRS